MGLLEKAIQYRASKKSKKKPTKSLTASDLTLQLFEENNFKSQSEIICDFLIQKFNINKITVHYLLNNDDVYTLLGSRGILDRDMSQFNISYYSTFLKAMHQVMSLSDLKHEPKFREELNVFIEKGLQMIFPLQDKDEIKGLIFIGNKNNGETFNYQEIEEMNDLMMIINRVFHCTSLWNRSVKKDEEIIQEEKSFVLLFENLKNINLADNLEEAIKIFFQALQDTCQVTAAHIMLRDKSSKEFKVRQSLGLNKEMDKKFKISFDDTIFQNIIELGEPMLIPDFTQLNSYKQHIPSSVQSQIKMFYTLPIKLSSECYGLLNIFNMSIVQGEEIPSDLEKLLSSLPLGILPYIIRETK